MLKHQKAACSLWLNKDIWPLWLSRLDLLQMCMFSYHVLWSLAPWIEPSARLSVCGWALGLNRKWSLASLESRLGLYHWLPTLDTVPKDYSHCKLLRNFKDQQRTAGRHRCFTNKLLISRVKHCREYLQVLCSHLRFRCVLLLVVTVLSMADIWVFLPVGMMNTVDGVSDGLCSSVAFGQRRHTLTQGV